MVSLAGMDNGTQSDMDNNSIVKQEESVSSDEGNSAMVSDGDRSGSSSPPSAGEMSVEEGSQQVLSPPDVHNQGESSHKMIPLDMLLPADQLVALAAMIPPTETVESNALVLNRETPSMNNTRSMYNQSPLTYASLEERSISSSSLRRLGEVADQVYDSSFQPLSHESETSEESGSNPLKLVPSRSLQKLGIAKAKQGIPLRRGKWTVEEEAYVARVIQDFNSGFLDAPAGTTLRTYLSEKLKCDPMRITKKFTGDACIGKRVFHPAVRSSSNATTIDKAQAELETLERRWRRRLETQLRESAKKAAASAAVAAAASSSAVQGTSSENTQPNAVAQTALWLDRAKSALLETPDDGTDLQHQMQEVQQLLHEGPGIQQTSAELPHILDEEARTFPVNDVGGGVEVEPADKRMKTTEDAEALVGFLRRVRASAASGEEF